MILITLIFSCTYIVLKASSCVTFSMIFATTACIVCIDSGTRDTIHVSLALPIRFFDISINRYTPIEEWGATPYLFNKEHYRIPTAHQREKSVYKITRQVTN